MLKPLIGALGLLFALYSYSAVYTTHIRDLDHGEQGEKILLLLANGKVAYLPAHSQMAGDLEGALKRGTLLRMETNASKEVISVQALEEEKRTNFATSFSQRYEPSILPSLEKAKTVFKSMNRKANEESQCYNRAHVWSWEMYNSHIIRPQKIFIFFTTKYIRRYNFDWWFHVSPYVLTKEDGQTVERVMDFKYSNGPKLMKEWTDIFMKNDPQCQDIEKYTDYEYHRGEATAPWCMLLRASMYYYQPLDLENLDKRGKVKDFWVEWELANAYREAFNYRH